MIIHEYIIIIIMAMMVQMLIDPQLRDALPSTVNHVLDVTKTTVVVPWLEGLQPKLDCIRVSTDLRECVKYASQGGIIM